MSNKIPHPNDPTGKEGSVQFFRWTYYNNYKWLGVYASQMWEHYEKQEHELLRLREFVEKVKQAKGFSGFVNILREADKLKEVDND